MQQTTRQVVTYPLLARVLNGTFVLCFGSLYLNSSLSLSPNQWGFCPGNSVDAALGYVRNEKLHSGVDITCNLGYSLLWLKESFWQWFSLNLDTESFKLPLSMQPCKLKWVTEVQYLGGLSSSIVNMHMGSTYAHYIQDKNSRYINAFTNIENECFSNMHLLGILFYCLESFCKGVNWSFGEHTKHLLQKYAWSSGIRESVDSLCRDGAGPPIVRVHWKTF